MDPLALIVLLPFVGGGLIYLVYDASLRQAKRRGDEDGRD